MPRTIAAKQRMIQAAVDVMRERGVEATSFADVLEQSGAPRGSVYHHFPSGKTELIEQATRSAEEFMRLGEKAALTAGPLNALDQLADYWRGVLRASDFAAGCPIVAVSVEGDLRPEARQIAGEVFAGWEKLMADGLRKEGVDRRRARSLATTLIAAIEGAVILARAQRSLAPFDRVAQELRLTLTEAVSQAAKAA